MAGFLYAFGDVTCRGDRSTVRELIDPVHLEALLCEMIAMRAAGINWANEDEDLDSYWLLHTEFGYDVGEHHSALETMLLEVRDARDERAFNKLVKKAENLLYRGEPMWTTDGDGEVMVGIGWTKDDAKLTYADASAQNEDDSDDAMWA